MKSQIYYAMILLLNYAVTFKLQVLLKEHKDSIRALSLEYARLVRENQELRAIIKGNKHIHSQHSCLSHSSVPNIHFEFFLAGQEALSVLQEDEEVDSPAAGSGSRNDSTTTEKEQVLRKTAKER